MDPQPRLSIAEPLRSAIEFKVDLLKRHGAGVDADLPLAAIFYREDEAFAFVLPVTGSDDLGRRGLVLALALTDCDRLVVVADTYVWLRGDATDMPDFEVDLEAEFRAGNPLVTEAIMAVQWTANGDSLIGLHGYRVEPGARSADWFVIDDHASRDEAQAAGGRLHDVAMRGFELQRERTTAAAEDWADLARMVPPMILRVLPPPRTPGMPRNAPCPCGSGRKAKHCCFSTS